MRSISFFHSCLITFNRPSGLMSSLAAGGCLLVPLGRSVPETSVVPASLLLSPPLAAAYFAFSNSASTPLLSRISCVTFIVSMFFKF